MSLETAHFEHHAVLFLSQFMNLKTRIIKLTTRERNYFLMQNKNLYLKKVIIFYLI